jgi:hypothetical protein
MTRRVRASIKSHGGHFEPYYKCIVSGISRKTKVSGSMLIRIFVLFRYAELARKAHANIPVSPYIKLPVVTYVIKQEHLDNEIIYVITAA